MLNKGPYILKAIHCLDDVLSRMRPHRNKKSDLLRKLRVAQGASAHSSLKRRTAEA
jgi:pyruvate kinase